MHALKLIALYSYVCEVYNQEIQWNVQRFSPNGLKGQITDEELLTIYLFCLLYEEKYKLKSMHTHMSIYWADWFPYLPAYQTFVDRLNRLADGLEHLVCSLLANATLLPHAQQILSQQILSQQILLGDSMPIMTCSGKRAGKVAPELTNKGFCSVKGIYYYGCKLHALALKRHQALPMPRLLALTPAAVHDLAALRPVLEHTHAYASVLDKAYCDKSLASAMQVHENELVTPIKTKKGVGLLIQQFDKAADQLTNQAIARIRQPIESFFNWLQEKTQIHNASKVRSEKGLRLHIFGRLAAALLLLIIF